MATKKKKSVKKKIIKKKTRGRIAFEVTDKLKDIAYQGAKKGLNEKEISRAMGIGYTTFCKNKQEFTTAIKKGRSESSDGLLEEIENSLLKQCRGFYVEETVTEESGVIDDDGKKFTAIKLGKRKTTKKYIAPSSPRALIPVKPLIFPSALISEAP